MTNLGQDEILDCNTSFERSLSKLSENYIIFDIGSTIHHSFFDPFWCVVDLGDMCKSSKRRV